MRFLFTFLLFSICAASNAQIHSYVPTNGLVGWWPFNGNANDESGNGNNGTVNGATLTTDRFGNMGKAYSFDGSTDFIEVTHNSTLSLTTGVSFSLWLNIPDSSLNTTTTGLVAREPLGKQVSPTVSGIGFETSDGIPPYFTPQFYIQGGVEYEDIAPLVTNSWFQLVGTYDGTTLKLYKNSILIGSNTGTFNLTTLTQNLFFGKQGALGTYFKGKIDDVGMFNRALTQQEITQLYTRTISTPTPEDTTSNVGIGTITPKRKLHVNDVMRLEPRDTVPANPAKGDIYFDGELNKLRYYNGTSWINL